MYKRKRPRALTLTLPNSKQPSLMMDGREYALRNFSQEGVGVWVQAPLVFGLTPGSKVSGDVVIGKEIFPVKMEVRHCSPGMVGLQFTGVSQELSGLFKKLLEPSNEAIRLKPHPKSGTEDPEFGFPRLWYVSESGAELLVWYNAFQKMVIGLQLCWQGKWVFRRQYGNPLTGYLKDEREARPGQRVLTPSLVEQHAVPSMELLQESAQFLTSLPGPLPGALLWQFLELGDQIYLPAELLSTSEVA